MSSSIAQQRGTFSGSSDDEIALAFEDAVTAGRTLACFVGWNSATATCTVSDDVNGDWDPVPDSLARGASGFLGSSQIFVLETTALGTPEVTAVTSVAVAYRVLHIFEISGADTGDLIDDANDGAGNSTSPQVGLTVGASAALVLGGCYVEQTAAAGAGWTAAENTDGNQTEYGNRSSGVVTVAFTQSPSGRWVASAIAFADAVDPDPAPEADGFTWVDDEWVASMGQLRSGGAWI